MTTIEIQLSDATAKAARETGLLTPQVLDTLLTDALKRRRPADSLLSIADRVGSAGIAAHLGNTGKRRGFSELPITASKRRQTISTACSPPPFHSAIPTISPGCCSRSKAVRPCSRRPPPAPCTCPRGRKPPRPCTLKLPGCSPQQRLRADCTGNQLRFTVIEFFDGPREPGRGEMLS